MSTYHVLVLYPEHVAQFYGEAYLWSGEAESMSGATYLAKQAMVEANSELAESKYLIVSLVVKGGEVL